MRPLLLAAALALAGCQTHLELPMETGAPGRPLPPDVVVTVEHADLWALSANKEGGHAILAGKRCTITLPFPHQISTETYEHIMAHEMKHCAGQQHGQLFQLPLPAPTHGIPNERPTPRYRLEWRP